MMSRMSSASWFAQPLWAQDDPPSGEGWHEAGREASLRAIPTPWGCLTDVQVK
jgi:hypothetical protein